MSNYKESNFVDPASNYDWETSVERIHELRKQNGGFYSGDAMPSIPFWHFYFEDNTEKGNAGWFMRVLPESGTVRGGKEYEEKFLWEFEQPVASSWEQILHCQYGDLTTDPPFKFHAVRSLGFALLEPEFYDNLTRCRLLQHIHDNFNIWLRTTDPADRARAAVQEFANLGMLRPGIEVVPQAQRHQIDAELVEMGMSQMKQLKQEASSTYTQQVDTGTRKEQTAFETNVKMQQVNAMLGGLLLTAFKYETYTYEEICRRFCLPHSTDGEVRKFQERCAKAGISRRYLDVSTWEVEPVTPLGMGNPTVAQAASQQLMNIRPAYPPSAQQEILHEATLVITQDPRKAARWAPLGQDRDVTNGEEYVQGIFGTLLTGVPIRPVERFSPMEQIDALLPLFAGKIALIEKRDNMARPDEVAGLQNVHDYLGGLIQRLAQDKAQRARVKKYTDDLGKLWNQVEGLAQRGAEAQKQAAQPGANGNGHSDAAKAQALLRQTNAKLQADAAKAKADEKLAASRHIREERRKDAAAFSELQRQQTRSRMTATEE